MQLVRDPTRFDVLVMDNLYGDILSDLARASWAASGWCPAPTSATSARSSRPCTAARPTSRGKGVANPTALVLSAAMMLDTMGERDAASRVEGAWRGSTRRPTCAPTTWAASDEQRAEIESLLWMRRIASPRSRDTEPRGTSGSPAGLARAAGSVSVMITSVSGESTMR
jgi:isocitrate/isopropylmalate dehydrogenase